ncbi:MAG: radical SAM protein, partial [bacterium]|nr:radical SAM protein [bacterium]
MIRPDALNRAAEASPALPLPTAARLWTPLTAGRLRCLLCAHRCQLAPGERGPCSLRHNLAGKLVTDAFGELRVALGSAVERRPFFHLLPGALTWTVATAGCSLRCRYCQNAPLSQPQAEDLAAPPRLDDPSPRAVVAAARAAGAQVLAFAYSEPSVAWEWVHEVMAAAREAGLLTAWSSNGFYTPELHEALARHGVPDAVNIDLKADRPETWRELVGGRLEPVLDAMTGLRQLSVWLEITTPLIPGINDSPAEREALAGHILERLGPTTPWHLWRFHPDWRLLDRPPTPTAALLAAAA